MIIKALDDTPLNSLTKGSMKKVLLQCDTCGKETETTYSNYVQGQKTRNFSGETYCRSCCKAVGGRKQRGKKCPALSERNRRLSGGKHPSWKGGSYINNWGYRMIHTGAKKSDTGSGWCCYEFEHRLVMEAHLGRKIQRGEIIHHINGDKLDNRIENLDLCSSEKEHREAHTSLEKLGMLLVRAGLVKYDRDSKSYGESEKLRELLEHPEEGNQQPSSGGDSLEGSTTRSNGVTNTMRAHERGALDIDFDQEYSIKVDDMLYNLGLSRDDIV